MARLNASHASVTTQLRQISRSLRVLYVLLSAGLEIVVLAGFSKSRADVAPRWLKRTCRRLLRAMRIKVTYSGAPPSRGLLVCNHLSYLDIIVLGARQQIAFVSKAEVRHWPLIGWLTCMAGTIYISREDRTDVARVNQQLSTQLAHGRVVCIFPEGTSSDGSRILPFRPSLLQPIVELGCTITPAHIRYHLPSGSVEDEVCYWRDMEFGPHLLNLLRKRRIECRVNYGAQQNSGTDRKALAKTLHECVVALSVAR